jgi:hypothetical protein
MYLNTSVGIQICFVIACSIANPAQAASSLWEHNGSTMYLVANGAAREFHYYNPRIGMLQAGALPGSLLFHGRSVNGRYVGTAYLFNPDCGQFPYQVSGPILNDYERVVLKGEAPRIDANCNIVEYFTDTLEFSFLKPMKRIPNVLDDRAGLPPISLSNGATLRVVNVVANDVLKMREYPTESSRVIDVIPPNATEVVYLGETRGPWLFVRYDRAEGWINRVFVEPMVSRGRRF